MSFTKGMESVYEGKMVFILKEENERNVDRNMEDKKQPCKN
jgi:hypothetical protein